MSNLSILIVDSNNKRLQSLSMLLEFMEHSVTSISSLENSIENQPAIELVIMAIDEPAMSNDYLLELNRQFPQVPFALLEGAQNLPLDVISQKFPLCLGGLSEPFKQTSIVDLINELDDFEIPEHLNATAQIAAMGNANQEDMAFLENTLIGRSKAIQMVRKLIAQVAKSNANVLILGESGTGKEVVANCIHQLSSRHSNAYVPVNCGAIPGDLLESELFGHEKGAFTGAISARKGRFELAQGGTLFLDEIGDMPLPMQVKILRVLQERVFERVGGNKSLTADVRVLAATHRDLEQNVSEGKFREDLFYRLNVFPIEIVPLKERVEDLPLLIAVLNQQMIDEKEVGVSLSDQALASLFKHPWPGNVRELANLIERLGIMFPDEEVEYDYLPPKYQYDIDDFDFEALQEYKQMPESLRAAPSHNEGGEPQEHNEAQENTKANDLNQESILEPAASQPINGSNGQAQVGSSQTESPQSDLTSGGVETILNNEEFDLKAHLSNLEQMLIEQALEQTGGVVAHAAKRLNIRRTTLVEKMRKYEISGK